MRTRDSMACAVACAVWDQAEQLALVAPHSPSLIAIGFKRATVEMQYTHVDP